LAGPQHGQFDQCRPADAGRLALGIGCDLEAAREQSVGFVKVAGFG
jgi:hypothetical protein